MQGTIVSAAEAVRSFPRLLTGLAQKDGAYYITDGDGQARAVLMDIDRYNAMMDALEDWDAIPEAKIAGAVVKAILERSIKSSKKPN